jgi:hypothetical protein
MTYKKLYALLCWCQGQQPISVWRHDTKYLDKKKLRELLMASQTGTIFILFLALEDIPSLMFTSNKLFPGVTDTIPSDKKTRGHIFS